MLNSLPQPSGPPAPPEPVPFPEQEGPRALPAADVGIPGTHAADATAYASVAAAASGEKPLTEQQVRNFFDFLNSRNPDAAPIATASESPPVVDASFDYSPSAAEAVELSHVVRLETTEIQDRLRLMSQAADSGMFGVAEYVMVVLIEFQRRHFERHQRIISLTEAWAMLVGVVNLALPDEK